MDPTISLQALFIALAPNLIMAFVTDYFLRENRAFFVFCSVLINSLIFGGFIGF